jgi:ubiquinone/menaquinone biosynthesis C-methylase UbiE
VSPAIDYNAIAAEYGLHRQVHPHVLQKFIETGRLRPDSHVLEVGCGTGNYVLALERQLGLHAWGIDPSERMLAQAHARAGNVQLKPGRAESLDFPAGAFDLVFSVDVIHHVKDRPEFFREAYRVAKLGGRVCTVSDSEWIIRNRRPLSLYFPETVEPEVARYPKIAQLREWMEQAGFGELIEEVVEFPYALTDAAPYRDRAFSSLHLISEEAFRRGVQRIERDLQQGPIACVSRYLLLWGNR